MKGNCLLYILQKIIILAQLLRLSHAKYAFNKIKIEKKKQGISEIPRTFQRLHVFPDRILPSWGLHGIPKFQGLHKIPGYTHSL